MFQLLYPIGLLAAIGIVLPILIHLWDIKSGKTLKIGSVAFLGVPSNLRSRSLKITDLPLLLLRCLLIGLIALLLAAPAYRQKLATTTQPGWILVEKSNFNKLWRNKRKQLDSLILKGYEIHDFDLNFARLQLSDTSSKFSRSASRPLSYYSLLKQLDGQHQQVRKVYAFADNRLSRFEGKQPVLHLDLNWIFLPADSTETTWISDSYQTNNQVYKQTIAHSTSTGTYFSSAQLSLKDTAGLQVDTANFIVQIYQHQASIDAGFVKAAVLALRQYTGRKIEVRIINSAKQISADAKLVFWLSDQQPSAADIKNLPQGSAVFQYAGNKIEKLNSSIQDQLGIALNGAELYKRTTYTTQPIQDVWVDAAGNPILSLDAKSGIKRYKFYSRFRPDWNNLVWTNGMVLFLTPIVLPQAAAQFAFQPDHRSLTAVQEFKPLLAQTDVKAEHTKYAQRSLSPWFWWLAFVLLFLERWFSYRKNVRIL
jgi:hypothetical protein